MESFEDISRDNLQEKEMGFLEKIFSYRYSPYFAGILICQIGLWWIYRELDRNIFSLVFTAIICFFWERLSPWKETYDV